jgi:uncharacterized protein YdeI (BOF family)
LFLTREISRFTKEKITMKHLFILVVVLSLMAVSMVACVPNTGTGGSATPTVEAGLDTPTAESATTPAVEGTATVEGDTTPTVEGDTTPTVEGDTTPTVEGEATMTDTTGITDTMELTDTNTVTP